ncbi:MAG TPA: hypothetical protein VE226_02125 [Nitrososphaeraceae archaeon]|nr:hypothetical protein [Nitrososphaeraceae archaeon]
MQKSKETKIALMAITTTLSTMILLLAAATTIAPLQQAYSLSKVVDNTNPATEDANGKIYQPLEQEPSNTARPIPTTTSNSSIVPVGCAMDTIESLESFLSCLGAK